jgi:WD40 repeat protein
MITATENCPRTACAGTPARSAESSSAPTGASWRPGARGGLVKLWDTSPDGRTLAAVGDARVPRGVWSPAPEATVHLWDLDTGKETTWKGHTGDVHGLAFSPAGPLLATCAEDDTVRLWDYSTGAAGVRVLGPGPFGGGVRAVAFTPGGRYLATANANGTVYLLRVGWRPAAPHGSTDP